MAGVFEGIVSGLGGLMDLGWGIGSQINQWNREDTAIQRRVADLKAAGLSPVLAAGQGASSSPPIHQPSAQDVVSKALSVKAQQAQIAQTQAQTRVTNAQARKLEAYDGQEWNQTVSGNGEITMTPGDSRWIKLARMDVERKEQEIEYLKERRQLARTQDEQRQWDIDLRAKEYQLKKIKLEQLEYLKQFWQTDKIFQYGGDIFNALKDILPFMIGRKKARY